MDKMENTASEPCVALLNPPNVLSDMCPSRQILNHMTSRWGILVLLVLHQGTHRFSAIRRKIGGVSERMLAQTLQVLDADGLVLRRAFDVVPPHVEYSLTPLGVEGADHALRLARWVETNLGAMVRPEKAA
jgi:DNA-binding HxlR family transcriptional regulator